VDSFKHILLPPGGRLTPEMPFSLDIAFVGVFAVIMTLSAAYVFERRK